MRYSTGPNIGLDGFFRMGLRLASVLLVVATTSGATAQVQRATRLRPSPPTAQKPADPETKTDDTAKTSLTPQTASPTPAPAPAAFTSKEKARLRATYDSLDQVEKEEMQAVFKDMGVDLAVLFGLAPAAVVQPPMTLPDAVRALKFARKPAAVLAARSQLGFAAGVMPDRSNTEPLAKWLHMNVMAGEWKVFADFLPLLSSADATAVYSHILRSTNEGAESLLPEEVLALGDACPGEMVDWQLDVLSQMLKKSAGRYGKGQLLGQIRSGTRLFGGQDDARRERTVRLLVDGGLAQEAYEYLAPLDQARQSGDARVIYAHARYYLDLVGGGRAGAKEEGYLSQAWQLLGEVSLMSGAEVKLRKDAMTRAIDLLTRVPPAQASEWLSKVFASESLGPAALEVVALRAMTFQDEKIDAAKRAQGLATMKAAVDTLLAQENLDLSTLRIPLRMLTSALADEVDAVVKAKGAFRGVPRETELLFRASPDERWLGAIEPSVSIRGYRAAIAIATIADETDVALDVLSNAVRRFPESGMDFADEFLKLWKQRLNPRNAPRRNINPFIFYGRQQVPAAPLTRGRQRRNLDRLERLITLMESMGVHARRLPSVTAVFKACHARTEVIERDQILRVFGPLDQLPAETAAALAESMRVGLGGDWRNRQAQQSYGFRRSRAEIGELVEVGYELAIELAVRARDSEPDSWRHAVLKAALNYDRLQYKQTQKQEDFATYNEYRRQAFSAFEQASLQYAGLVAQGLERDSAGVYVQWFAAVLDAGQTTPDEDLAAETAANEDQIERIGEAMRALPADAYQRHVGAFAREVVDSLSSVPPEKKPTIVRSAVRIVGDHPAGAPLRGLFELYQDLLKDEIRMRITVDGSDRVSHGGVFAAVLSLRYTNSVDRETGGFDKYLYQDTYVRIGNQYRSVNYQAQLRRGIETAFGDSFSIESIGFFEPLTPSRAVREDGQLGWQEKPMAYILVKAKDPSVDRLPQISFDMHFDDQSGPVTLPILSNSPPIDATQAGGTRPVKKLEVEQILDARRLVSGTEDRAVTLEVHAKGQGVIPGLDDLLDGCSVALPGYEIAEDGIEARPLNVIQRDDGPSPRYAYASLSADEKDTYATADEDGIFRLETERSWLITFKPTGGAVGSGFQLPTLKPDLEGTLVSRQYTDMDVVQISGAFVALTPRWSLFGRVGTGIGVVAFIGLIAWRLLRRRRPADLPDDAFPLPSRITPLSTIAALQRIGERAAALAPEQRARLASDITAVQQAHFGPGGSTPPDETAMRELLQHWSATVRDRGGSMASIA